MKHFALTLVSGSVTTLFDQNVTLIFSFLGRTIRVKLEGRSSKDHISLRFPFEEDQMIMKTGNQSFEVFLAHGETFQITFTALGNLNRKVKIGNARRYMIHYISPSSLSWKCGSKRETNDCKLLRHGYLLWRGTYRVSKRRKNSNG